MVMPSADVLWKFCFAFGLREGSVGGWSVPRTFASLAVDRLM